MLRDMFVSCASHENSRIRNESHDTKSSLLHSQTRSYASQQRAKIILRGTITDGNTRRQGHQKGPVVGMQEEDGRHHQGLQVQSNPSSTCLARLRHICKTLISVSLVKAWLKASAIASLTQLRAFLPELRILHWSKQISTGLIWQTS